MDYNYLRLLSLLIILLFSISLNHSQTYISEINFIDDEYLEIYSDEVIDFSNFRVYDDNGLTKNNTLELVQNSSSNYYLFAGSSFIESNNISNVNCTIYQTSGSQLSNGGLKQNGENLNLTNKTLNFFWNKEENLQFEPNQSLHFHNNSQFISNQSICSLSIFSVNQVDTNNQISSNNSNTTSPPGLNETPICNNTFSISIQPREITQKIEFDFSINNSNNISIEYWVENYEGEILKNKLTTQNTNTKSYTPTKTNPIIIKSILTQNNCSYQAQKETFFYKYHEEEQEEIVIEEEQDLNSNFKLLTRTLKGSFLELSFELYRGDTSKRTLYILNNKKQQHSIELPEKFSKIKTKLKVELEEGENIVVFNGIEINQELKHFLEPKQKEENFEEIVQTKLPKIVFFNTSQSQNMLTKPIMLLEEYQLLCNIYQKNTKVSKEYFRVILPGFYIIEQEINQSKLKVDNNQTKVEIKQTCKYKSPELKTYNNEISYFNYSIPNTITSVNSELEKITLLSKDSKILDEKNTKIGEKELYSSAQKSLREKANIPIMGVMSALLIGFLVIW